MPRDYDKDAYPEPPQRTPVVDKQTAIPNPLLLISQVFYYTVEYPVTSMKAVIDNIRSKNQMVYYHRKYRRVPDLTECKEGDLLCMHEAELQWQRDFKVDQKILNIVQERLSACNFREGASQAQNCAKEMQVYNEVANNFLIRYGELGGFANARKCLAKQQARMIDARASAKSA